MKRLMMLGVLGAVLLLGLSALAACPPGSTVVATPGALPAPVAGTTYCIQASGPRAVAYVIGVDNVTIVGENPFVTIQLDAGAAQIQITGNNVTIRDITIDATDGGVSLGITTSGMNTTIANVRFLDSVGGGYDDAVIRVTGGTATISGCVITQGQGDGIQVSGGNDVHIIGNTITTTGITGAAFNVIDVTAGIGHVIRGNTIDSTTRAANPTAPVINAAYTGAVVVDNVVRTVVAAGGHVVAVTGANSVVRNNELTVTGGAGVVAAHGVNVTGANSEVVDNRITMGGFGNEGVSVGAANVVVRNNRIFRPGQHGVGVLAAGVNAVVEGNTISGPTGDGVNLAAPNVRVAQNAISGPGGDGIEVTTSNNTILANTIANAGANGVLFSNAGATNNTVEGNIITDAVTHGIAFTAAATNNTLRGNTIRSPGTNGINFGANACTNTTVVDNVIENALGTGGNNGGISSTGAISNSVFQGNTIRNGAWYGIRINAAALNLRIVGNTVTGNGATGISLTGGATNAVVENNTVRDNGSEVFGFGEGIAVDAASNNTVVRGNTVSSTRVLVVESRGIRVGGVNNVIVENNTVTNDATGTLDIGILVDFGTVNSGVRGNTVAGMRNYGLLLRGGSTTLGGITVTGNRLTGNVTGVYIAGGVSTLSGCNVISQGAVGLHVAPAVNAANFTITGNDITSPVRVRNQGVGVLVVENNWWGDPAGPPAGSMLGDVDFTPWATTACGTTAPGGTSNTYGAAGWYLVSVPTTGDTAAIFGVTLWNWNGTQYVQATALNPNMGYWANLPANKTVTATGTVPTTDQTLALTRTGWHMVSAPWAYPKSAIVVVRGTEVRSWADAVAAGWVRDVLWSWNGTQYVAATTMQPWYGYWLRALVDNLTIRFLYASRVTTMCVSCGLEPASALDLTELPPPPPTGVTGAASLTFGNSPNPITDVHTTTFRVTGPMASLVTEIKVVVFDLSGKLVWQGSASGAELTWHTDDLAGRYLANGVYLYQITAKVAGTTVSSPLLKLAIYR